MSEVDEKELSELDRTIEAVEKIKNFDAEQLVQTARLGQELAFNEARESAEKIIRLYGQIRTEALDDFPPNVLNQIKEQAEQHYSLFDQIITFSPSQDNAAGQRQQLIDQLSSSYAKIFQQLQPTISYSSQRVTDFSRLELEGKHAVEAVWEKVAENIKHLEEAQREANVMLENVREAAGELGVSQQAIAFDESVNHHTEQSEFWHKRMLMTGGLLGLYAISTMFFHSVPWFENADPIQFTVSKILVFGVISSYLYICIRNYTSHKHNAVVDKHRQNALRTFKALMDAAEGTPHSEVILVHAAACIFGPQSTGYTKETPATASPVQQAVELFSPAVRRD